MRRIEHGHLDIAASLGGESWLSRINKFGHNADTGANQAIWSASTAWNWPTFLNGAQFHDVGSTSPLDVSGGTHTQEIFIVGIGEDWSEQTETLTMPSAPPPATVSTAKKYRRIYRMYQTKCNTHGGVNQGDISATAALDGTVTAFIENGRGQTEMAIYTVPLGKILLLTNIYATINRGGGGSVWADLALATRGPMDVATGPTRIRFSFAVESAGSSSQSFQRFPFVTIPEKMDVEMRTTGTSAGTIDISAGFDGYLIDKEVYFGA